MQSEAVAGEVCIQYNLHLEDISRLSLIHKDRASKNLSPGPLSLAAIPFYTASLLAGMSSGLTPRAARRSLGPQVDKVCRVTVTRL